METKSIKSHVIIQHVRNMAMNKILSNYQLKPELRSLIESAKQSDRIDFPLSKEDRSLISLSPCENTLMVVLSGNLAKLGSVFWDLHYVGERRPETNWAPVMAPIMPELALWIL